MSYSFHFNEIYLFIISLIINYAEIQFFFAIQFDLFVFQLFNLQQA